jgi:uncharacterized membrane protein YeaQ/YmgE (transglycosylase-associated protein family)
MAGALLGYLIFTKWIGWGDDDIFDVAGIFGAIIGVMILLPIFGYNMKRRARRNPSV